MKKIKKKIIFVSLIVIFSVLIDQASKIVAYIQKDTIGDGIQILCPFEYKLLFYLLGQLK